MIAQFQKYGYNKSGKNGTYAIGIKKKGVLQHSLFCAGHLIFSCPATCRSDGKSHPL